MILEECRIKVLSMAVMVSISCTHKQSQLKHTLPDTKDTVDASAAEVKLHFR